MIDKNSHVPIYLQIERILRNKINSGDLQLDKPIPSEIELAKQYDVSRMTIRNAVSYLVREGMLERYRGKGTFISQRNQALKMALPLDKQLTSNEVASHLHAPITNKLLHFEKIKAPSSIALDLEIEADTPIWFMKRLRLIDNIPFVFESSYMLCAPLFEDLTENDLNNSKYEYLARKNCLVKNSQKQIKAVLPTEEVGKLLEINRDEAILFAHSVSILESGTKFDVSNIYYNQAHYTFTLNAHR